jgi:hypothetical protein
MILCQILKAELHFGDAGFLLLEKIHGNVGVILAMILASQHSFEKSYIFWKAFWRV